MLELSRQEIFSNAERLAKLLQRAYEKYPFTLWTLECFEEGMREAILKERLLAFFLEATESTHCFCAPDWSALAIVQEEEVDLEKHKFREAIVAPERLRNLMETTHKLLPSMSTHYYLEVLAVDPECQQKGAGSKLLSEVWEWTQTKSPKRGMSLHTSTELNVKFYTKNHFKLKHHVRYVAENAQPLDVWVLLRDPETIKA